ncbi:MAG: hypothetical protein GY786_23830 [Proteobacteria bacterium]|nr:hypothetical protein [Pseudomonadota bacterium]
MKTKLITIILTLLVINISTVSAASLEGIKNKMGGINYTHSTANYILTNTTTSATGSDAIAIKGTTIFYERMLTGRFSLGFTYSSFLERTSEFSVGSVSYSSLEKISMYSIDFKSYFEIHKREGWKPYMGVSFGSYTAASELTVNTLGTLTDEKTGATIPTTSLSFGYDWVLEFGGLRFDYTMMSGKRSDSDTYTGHKATYDYTNSSVFGIGVYSFF